MLIIDEIKGKNKKKSGSKTQILRNLEAQPERLVSYKKKSVFGHVEGSINEDHVENFLSFCPSVIPSHILNCHLK